MAGRVPNTVRARGTYNRLQYGKLELRPLHPLVDLQMSPFPPRAICAIVTSAAAMAARVLLGNHLTRGLSHFTHQLIAQLGWGKDEEG